MPGTVNHASHPGGRRGPRSAPGEVWRALPRRNPELETGLEDCRPFLTLTLWWAALQSGDTHPHLSRLFDSATGSGRLSEEGRRHARVPGAGRGRSGQEGGGSPAPRVARSPLMSRRRIDTGLGADAVSEAWSRNLPDSLRRVATDQVAESLRTQCGGASTCAGRAFRGSTSGILGVDCRAPDRLPRGIAPRTVTDSADDHRRVTGGPS
jgi:hypothetical protein